MEAHFKFFKIKIKTSNNIFSKNGCFNGNIRAGMTRQNLPIYLYLMPFNCISILFSFNFDGISLYLILSLFVHINYFRSLIQYLTIFLLKMVIICRVVKCHYS